MEEGTMGCQAFADAMSQEMLVNRPFSLAEQLQLLWPRSHNFCFWGGEKIPQPRVAFRPRESRPTRKRASFHQSSTCERARVRPV